MSIPMYSDEPTGEDKARREYITAVILARTDAVSRDVINTKFDLATSYTTKMFWVKDKHPPFVSSSYIRYRVDVMVFELFVIKTTCPVLKPEKYAKPVSIQYAKYWCQHHPSLGPNYYKQPAGFRGEIKEIQSLLDRLCSQLIAESYRIPEPLLNMGMCLIQSQYR